MNRFGRGLRTIRARSALLAGGVVLLALILGGFALLQVYEGQLVSNLDATLEQQVLDRARLIDDGGSNTSLVTVLQEEAFVWIGTPDGVPTAMGGAIEPEGNPVPQNIGTTATFELLVLEVKPDEVERELMRLRIASTETETGLVVLAGSELEVVSDSVGDLARLFALAIPFIVLLVGALAWAIAGRVLRPVDAIRHHAATISGTTLGGRVPVPDSHDEIEALATTVNEMLDRIERHDVTIRQFSSDASHELKSPIANIRAMVETRSSSDASWQPLQANLTAETDRLAELVNNLLFLATHQDARSLVDPQSVALDELLFAEAEVIAATSDLRVDLSKVAPASLHGIRSELERLVRNLVDNAVRHADGRVGFSLTSSTTHVELAIADDGPGVDIADREQIFERFTRLDSARARDDGGTGLGLSIVKQIAETHDAEVAVDGSAFGGAVFTVRFPVQTSTEGAAAR